MRQRRVPLQNHIKSIRETGRGEGYLAPLPPRRRTRVELLDRAIRKRFKGLVGS